ncbi:2-isopropylmalate synthase [Candidatus Hydrogenisulfobacillus filiaventi]|uniref:2-isopropylmalate synthase n=1 Tax=Candidatus Hydrogenisulfobacillus filiaventi TaxID=2707344 RepID=A0A6F8ZEM4_9FIRM|nr:2-isopropylmalate synthase [Bacillota bacterium]CAB1128318.1 2-isopropylmalate synthase [Candidatus Hydrogenisulfobacillus filiaventi]
MSEDFVRIFDTTLRDGEQSPGVALTAKAKVTIAEQLARLNVDIIEAGFPAASEGDFAAVKAIAETVRGPVIAGLARCLPGDIEVAAAAVEKAERARIHVFIATSPLHMQAKLRMEPEQVLEQADKMVRLARSYVDDVEFSAEDATRSELDFLIRIATLAVKAGARTINIPDTVGYTTPDEFGAMVAAVRQAVAAIDPGVIVSVHCHNDIGLAVANSLAGVQAGARQVEVAVNGIGERAGNAALEEVVMALTNRRDHYGIATHIVTREIYRTSQMVSRMTGMLVQPNKAVVGLNAFRHEAGIHQDGMLKNRQTYEVLRPEDIGVPESLLVLGKHSGRHALRQRLNDLQLKCTEEELARIQAQVKSLAEIKNEINDADLEAIWADVVLGVHEPDIHLEHWQVSTGNDMRPTAQVSVRIHDRVFEDAGFGDGPVHALFNALRRALDLGDAEMRSYTLSPISPGEDGLATVRVEIAARGLTSRGQGTASDVLAASVEAMTAAMGQLLTRVRGPVVA